MCGGLNIVYGNKEIEYENSGTEPDPNVTFYIYELENQEAPLVDDLILNIDGCFYKVISVSDNLIETTRLTLQGTGTGGGSTGGGDGSGTWSINVPISTNVYSSATNEMNIEFIGYYNGTDDNYINSVSFSLGGPVSESNPSFYEINKYYAFNTLHSIDLYKYINLFGAIASTVYINVTDKYGIVRNKKFTIQVVNLSLTAERDKIIKSNENSYTYQCKVGGARTGINNKKLIFNIYDENNTNVPIMPTIEDDSIANNYVGSWSSTLDLSGLEHGTYVLEVQASANIENSGITIPSNVLKHKIIKFSSENGNSLLTYSLPDEIEQYTNIPLNYYLASLEDNKNYTLDIAVDGNSMASLEITTNTLATYPLYFETKGNYNLTLTVVELGLSRSTVISVTEYIGELPIIDPNNQSLMLYLTPKGQSNSSINRDKWMDYHNRYTAELTNLHYSNANGWLTDDDGTAYLQLNSGGKMTIPGFYPFAQDPTQINTQNSAMGSGMTIEIDFEIDGITDYDADIIKCLSKDQTGLNWVGFTVTGNKIKFYSYLKNGSEKQGALTTSTIVEGKRVRLSFVIEPNDNGKDPTYFPMCYTYLNGILSNAVLYDKGDKFIESSDNPAQLYIDSTSAQIKIYGIRFYTIALKDRAILENYTASLPTLEERQSRFNSNDVYNDFDLIDYELVSSENYDLQIPYMTLTGGYATDKDNDKWRLYPSDQVGEPGLPTGKKDYRLVDVKVVYPNNEYFKDYKNYFYTNTFDNGLGMTDNFGKRANNGGCIMYAQGTSSMEYPVKNLRLRWKNDNDFYTVRPDISPVEIICMKADYMESSGSHNTGAANLVDDLYAAAGMKSPGQAHFGPQSADDTDAKTIVTCIKGHPCLIFYSPTGEKGTYEYVGKYNLNLDKATPQPFGFDHDDTFGWLPEGEEYWEIKYGDKDKDYQNPFVGQVKPDKGADYVPNQAEEKKTVGAGEKINSIHCFEFLDNAVAVCNFLNKKIGPEDPMPNEFYYEIDKKVSANTYKPNVYYLYNNLTEDYELDSSENFDSAKTYYSRTFNYYDSWYKTFLNSDSEPVPGWTLGFESRYPEDRVGYHDADMLYPLASWLNELYYLKQQGLDEDNQDLIDKANLRFKSEYECYLDKKFLLFYYIVTEALLMADNRVKNMMIATWGKSKSSYRPLKYDVVDEKTGKMGWMIDQEADVIETNNYIFYPIFYDMDTMLGLDNTGRNRFNYFDEDTDSSIYNGDEVLWNFVRDNLKSDLDAMYRALENGMLNIKTTESGEWRSRSLIPYFNNNQANMANEAFYNGDAVYKYLDPARKGYYDGLNGKDIAPGVGPYLYAAQGDRSLMREDFIINRIKFLRGKHNSDDFKNGDQIEFRWNFPSGTESDKLLVQSAQYVKPTISFTFTSLQPCFAGVMLGKNGNIYKTRFNSEETLTIDVPEGSSANNTEAYLLGLSSLKDLGDLSNKYVQKFVISGDSKLRTLTLGNPHKYYYNPYWSDDTASSKIDLSGCTYLQSFNLQNCASFQTALDFSNCPIIETILLTGSSASTLTLPINGNIKELRMPSSIRSLYIDSHRNLTNDNFSLGTYDYGSGDTIGNATGKYINDFTKLTDVCVINTPIDTYDILTNTVVLNSYYVHGFNWKITNTEKDNQYIKTSHSEPQDGVTYYIWDNSLNKYKVCSGDELTANWNIAKEKVNLVENGEIKRIPILDQLMTKKPLKGNQQVSVVTALSGTIEIAVPAKVNQFELYQKYNNIYPNVNIIYNKEIIGSDNLIPAYKIEFYNVNNITENTEAYYTVLTDGSYTLSELISDQGPAGIAMVAPTKQSTNEVEYHFTGQWKDVDTGTKYEQGTESFDYKPVKDLKLEPIFEEQTRYYTIKFYNYDEENFTEVKYTYNENMSQNSNTPMYQSRNDNDLGDYERYTFKGWIGEKDFINGNSKPTLIDLTTRQVTYEMSLYPYYEVEDATKIASDLKYFSFREVSKITLAKDKYIYPSSDDTEFDTPITLTSQYVLDVKPEYQSSLSGKITFPSKDSNGRTITALGNLGESQSLITHAFFLADAKYELIGERAFANNSNLNLIYFPENMDSLKYIGASAFVNNTNLSQIINLPNSIEYVGDSSFFWCPVEIKELPTSLNYIGKSGFLGCGNLAATILPHGITYILPETFAYCNKLNIAHFGNSTNGALSPIDNNLTHIGYSSFSIGSHSTVPTDIYLHNSLNYLGNECFKNYGNQILTIHDGTNILTQDSLSDYFGNKEFTLIQEDSH